MRVRDHVVPKDARLRDGNPTLPGLEGIRSEHRPMPEVADLPFTLTGGPMPIPTRARRSREAQAATTTRPPRRPVTSTPSRPHLPLLDRLDLVDVGGVIVLPDCDGESLRHWLHAQEPEYGREGWFTRMVMAVKKGDWTSAWHTAAFARVVSYGRALNGATTPEEKAAIRALIKGKLTACR
jgi:hypothetical protein